MREGYTARYFQKQKAAKAVFLFKKIRFSSIPSPAANMCYNYLA